MARRSRRSNVLMDMGARRRSQNGRRRGSWGGEPFKVNRRTSQGFRLSRAMGHITSPSTTRRIDTTFRNMVHRHSIPWWLRCKSRKVA